MKRRLLPLLVILSLIVVFIAVQVSTADHEAEEQYHHPSYTSYSHDGRDHHYGKSSKSSGHKGHGSHSHHGDHGLKEWHDRHNSDHGGHYDKNQKTSKGNYWDKHGEKEKIIKDKGSGFIKAFTWDREETNREKFGDRGGNYQDSHKSSKGKKYGRTSSGSAGKEKWGHDSDKSIWGEDGYDNSLNSYDDLLTNLDWATLSQFYNSHKG